MNKIKDENLYPLSQVLPFIKITFSRNDSNRKVFPVYHTFVQRVHENTYFLTGLAWRECHIGKMKYETRIQPQNHSLYFN